MTDLRPRNVFANGLTHHVLAWGEARAPRGTVVLLHGFADAAGTWQPVAEGLAARGLHVLAPDLRGFGQGPRAPIGTTYHFPDYVADVLAVIDAACGPDARPFLCGHSMGGTVAVYLAGAHPERFARVALLEGLGPPESEVDAAPDRLRRALLDQRALAPKRDAQRAMPSRDEALRRLAVNHPGVSVEVLRARIEHLVADVEGGVAWRSDPLHKAVSPTPFYAATFRAFCRRIACPVLAVSGGPTGFHTPDEEERLAAFPALTRAEIADAGHMMHWTRPEAVIALLDAFLVVEG